MRNAVKEWLFLASGPMYAWDFHFQVGLDKFHSRRQTNISRIYFLSFFRCNLFGVHNIGTLVKKKKKQKQTPLFVY